MLSAHSHLDFGSSTLQSTVFLERRMRVHLVRRDRLVFDTAYAPHARAATGAVHLFAQLFGTFEMAGAPPITAPCAFVLAETEFDRVVRGARTFRSFGARCTIIEARVPAADLRCPIGLAHGPIVCQTQIIVGAKINQLPFAEPNGTALRRRARGECAAQPTSIQVG